MFSSSLAYWFHSYHTKMFVTFGKHVVIIIKTTWCEHINILDTTENKPNDMFVSSQPTQIHSHEWNSTHTSMYGYIIHSHLAEIRPTWNPCLTSLVEFDYKRMLSIGTFYRNSYGPTLFQPIRMRNFCWLLLLICWS